MIEFFKKYGFSLWLGGSLGFIGSGFMTWQYWLVVIPTVLLVVWGRD